ncbi:MAG: hypothetical protein M1467_03075 [Deltaproteobacteria bacterium]|nr:hypothetical protein [Deltaproteobacteria bacterium]
MENEIVLRITKEEIFFSCKGYSEEFINTISDVINQKSRSLIELPQQPQQENPVSILKPETKALSHNRKIKAGRENIEKNKKGIIGDIEGGMGPDDIKEKYGISSSSFYRLKGKCFKSSTMKEGINTEKAKPKSPLSDSATNNLIRDVKAGMKFKDAAEKYGVNSIAYARCVRLSKSDVSSSESKPENPAKAKNTPAAVIENKKVNINNIQEKIHEKSLGPLAVNPEVRQWQKEMINRGF